MSAWQPSSVYDHTLMNCNITRRLMVFVDMEHEMLMAKASVIAFSSRFNISASTSSMTTQTSWPFGDPVLTRTPAHSIAALKTNSDTGDCGLPEPLRHYCSDSFNFTKHLVSIWIKSLGIYAFNHFPDVRSNQIIRYG